MSEILDNWEHARDLRRRLNDHSVDITLLAPDAATVFGAAGMHAQARWLELELNGYTSPDGHSLHQVLGLASDDRLVVQVKSYRIHRGHRSEGGVFHHFFVEPISEVVRARAVVHAFESRVGERLQLDFASKRQEEGESLTATFERDVFDRILLGLRAALHLQLAGVAA